MKKKGRDSYLEQRCQIVVRSMGGYHFTKPEINDNSLLISGRMRSATALFMTNVL